MLAYRYIYLYSNSQKISVNDRMFINTAAGYLGDLRATKTLIRALHDPDFRIRTTAVDGLKYIPSSRAVEPVLAMFRDKHPEVRAAACMTITSFQTPYAIPVLRKHLYDEEKTLSSLILDEGKQKPLLVRDFAVIALEYLDTPEARAAVEEWRKKQGNAH